MPSVVVHDTCKGGRAIQLSRRLTLVAARHSLHGRTLPNPINKPNQQITTNDVKTLRDEHHNSHTASLLTQWSKVRSVGRGLVNMGNTCFVNAVLQCLTHTPALAQYLLQRQHKFCRSGTSNNAFCVWCTLERHTEGAMSNVNQIKHQPYRPADILKQLRAISRHFYVGRQEDAHEFLRKLQETMQKHEGVKQSNCTNVEGVSGAIFGGRFRSQVVCLKCSHASNTYELFMDVPVDMPVKHLKTALYRFTRPETLRAPNLFRCDQCSTRVEARKQLTIEQAPTVLTLHLKRFNALGQKINQPIVFDERLDLAPFMSDTHCGGVQYSLIGCVVHYGGSMHSGHYVAFVRSPAGPWHRMDDEDVSRASLQTVRNERPYILFYSRSNPSPSSSSSSIPKPIIQNTSRNLDLATTSTKSSPTTKTPQVLQHKTLPIISINSSPPSPVSTSSSPPTPPPPPPSSPLIASAHPTPALNAIKFTNAVRTRLYRKTQGLGTRKPYSLLSPLPTKASRPRSSVFYETRCTSLRARQLETWTSNDDGAISSSLVSKLAKSHSVDSYAARELAEYNRDYDCGKIRKVRRTNQSLLTNTTHTDSCCRSEMHECETLNSFQRIADQANQPPHTIYSMNDKLRCQ